VKVRLTAFGISKDILNNRQQEFEFEGSSIADLKSKLIAEFPAFSKLAKLSFAVNEEYQKDDFVLSENKEVVIIPPVSGG